MENCPNCLVASEKAAVCWLQNLTMTTDDHWQTKGAPYKAPFPRKSYLRHVFGAMQRLLVKPELKTDALFLPKSRRHVGLMVGDGLYHLDVSVAPANFLDCQSAKEDKAAELLKYARTLCYNQPDWLRKRHALATDNLRSSLAGRMEAGSWAYLRARIRSASTIRTAGLRMKRPSCLTSSSH